MPTPPSLLLVLHLAVGVTSPSPACDAPCKGFTCGDYAALRLNCSEMLYIGCACKGCCADGTTASTRDAKGLLLAQLQPYDPLERASHLHHRRALEESDCLVPQLDLSGLVPSVDLTSFDLTSFDLSVFLHQDGGLIAIMAPVLRGPGDWLIGLVINALRDATGLSTGDNWVQDKIKRLFHLLFNIAAGVLMCRWCSSAGGYVSAVEQRQRDEAEEVQIKSLAQGARPWVDSAAARAKK